MINSNALIRNEKSKLIDYNYSTHRNNKSDKNLTSNRIKDEIENFYKEILDSANNKKHCYQIDDFHIKSSNIRPRSCQISNRNIERVNSFNDNLRKNSSETRVSYENKEEILEKNIEFKNLKSLVNQIESLNSDDIMRIDETNKYLLKRLATLIIKIFNKK